MFKNKCTTFFLNTSTVPIHSYNIQCSCYNSITWRCTCMYVIHTHD